MAFNVAAITAYTEQNKQDLISASVFGAKTISMITKMTGVKGSETLNIFDTDLNIQTGGNCTWSGSGDTTLTQRTMTVQKMTVMEQYCPNDLEGYYTQVKLPGGSHYSALPFEQLYAELKVKKIQARMETLVWQGNTSSAGTTLVSMNGLLKQIDAATGVIHATTSTINETNIRTIYKEIYTLIPVAILDKEDLVSFCGWDTFRTLCNKLTTDNLYHYTTDDPAKTGEMYYPGTNLKIVAVNGLNSTNRIITARTSNLYFGTDMLNEEEKFRIFEFEDGSNAIRMRADWKGGAQIAFPSEIVEYHNA